MAFSLRQGSWKIPTFFGMVGLPDFGATEASAKEISGGQTTDLSEAITGNYSRQAPTYDYSDAQSVPLQSTPSGSVLGANTVGTTNPVQNNPTTNPNSTTSSGPSYADIMYSQINSGWNNYFNDLDSMLNTTLPAQQTAQTNIANIGANQQISDLTATTDQNVASLVGERGNVEKGGVKTLQDIASNIANLMKAGNNYLGAIGASGSAPKQYAYALQRLGSEQRGNAVSQTRDLVSKVNDKISQVKNIFTQEKNRIQSELNIKTQEIASWFADAQSQIMTAKANGQLARSTDLQNLTTNLYNTAVQQLTNVQQQAANRQAMLEGWVANNSTTLQGLKSNLDAIGSFTAPTMSYNPISNPFNTQNQTGSQPGILWGGSAGSGGGSYDDYIKKLIGTA